MGALFGKPKPPTPIRMPDANDPAVKQSEERKRREIMARSGRSSTMLSRNAGGGGGGEAGTRSYSASLLGNAG